MIKLVIKFIIGVLIVPVAIAVSLAFYHNVTLIKELAASLNYFRWGISAYVILHLLFYKPMYLYVLGHEAVHAGVAWLFGARIKSFKVSGEGGSVGADRSNMVIELSPYFIPIHAIIITLVYFGIVSSYNVDGRLFVFLIGFCLALHIIMTIEVMKARQPDIVKSGYFFSIIFVYILNIIVISLIFSLLFPAFSAKKFFVEIWGVSKSMYAAIFKQLFL